MTTEYPKCPLLASWQLRAWPIRWEGPGALAPGKLTKLALSIDRPKLTPADEKRLMEEGQRNNRASE